MMIHLSAQTLRLYQRTQAILENLDPTSSPWASIAPTSPQPRGNVIVFPGSFNPPTLAHLALLRQARYFAAQQEDGVNQHRRSAGRRSTRWHIYTALSKSIVDKETVERMTLLDRAVLLERILARRNGHMGLLLLNRGLYVEQARGIRAAFPRVRSLYFLLGFDKIVQILDPRYYADREAALRELLCLARLLVSPRGQAGEAELRQLLDQPENRPFASSISLLPLEAKYREISATAVRQGDDPNLDRLPAEARDFVRGTRPYTPPLRLEDGTTHDAYAEHTRELQASLASLKAEYVGRPDY